jgi:hypothetical protein
VWSTEVIALLVATAIVCGILLDWSNQAYVVEHVNAATTTPVEVQIIVKINWTEERILQEIRTTFPETPDLAVAVARCESGLKADIQSRHVLSYGQERSFGVFQVHEPDWGKTADRLGLDNWRTDPGDNIKLARYIYEQAGKRWTPWSCYNKRMI